MAYTTPPSDSSATPTRIPEYVAAFLIVVGLLSSIGILILSALGPPVGNIFTNVIMGLDGSTAVTPPPPTKSDFQIFLEDLFRDPLLVINIVIGLVMAATGFGLLRSLPWSYNAALILLGIYVILGILSLLATPLNAGSAILLIFIVIAAVCFYLLASSAEVKRRFGK